MGISAFLIMDVFRLTLEMGPLCDSASVFEQWIVAVHDYGDVQIEGRFLNLPVNAACSRRRNMLRTI